MSTAWLPNAEGDANARRRLEEEFGLDLSAVMVQAILRAETVARGYRNALYPPGAEGNARWMHLVRYLSEYAYTREYERRDENNIARLVNYARKRIIVITAGDIATGLPWSTLKRDPKSRYPRGRASREAIEANQQPALSPALEALGEKQPSLSECRTWLLLTFRDKNELRSEISLPSDTDAMGHASSWSDRIILPSIGNLDTFIDDNDDEGNGEIDVPVDPL